MQLINIHRDWLTNQKITKEVLEIFGVFTSDDGKIAFPVLDGEGNFVFNKYRRSPENPTGAKYTYDKGGKTTLYGWHLAKDFDTILITEGEKDCLVAWSHNIPAVTSTGGALSFQEEWVDIMKDKKIIVCFDNDKAGGDGMAKVAKMFGKENIKIMFLPERSGVKDISDYVVGGGDLHNLLRTAKVITDIEDDKGERKSLWKSTFYHDAMLQPEKTTSYNNPKSPEKTDDELLNAKGHLITDIIEFNRDKKARCPFHNERTASLHYYPETNTTYCFGGCGKAYDAIDIYQKVNGVSFKEAIKELNK